MAWHAIRGMPSRAFTMLGWLSHYQFTCRPWWSIRGHTALRTPTHHQHRPCSNHDVHGTQPLHNGTPHDASTPSWLSEDRALTAAKQAAVRALNRRTMHSSQLREKLLQRGHPPEAIDTALEVRATASRDNVFDHIFVSQYLAHVGILHDADYAAAFARTAAYSKAWAPPRIRMELRRRGVEDAHIDAALAATLGGGDPSVDVDDERHHDPLGVSLSSLIQRIDAAVEEGMDLQAALDDADEAADGAMRSADGAARQTLHHKSEPHG